MLRAWICSVAVLALVPAGWAQAAGGKGDEKGLKVTGELTKDDPFDKAREKCHAKTYKFKMEANKTYVIDLKSLEKGKDFDLYLRLEDSGGKQLAEDDNGGGGEFGNDARITFTAPKTDTYVIIATTYGPGATGKFSLTAAPPSEKEGQFNQLKADFQKVSGDLSQKYGLSKSEEEKEKI